jgi:hypothetical protein
MLKILMYQKRVIKAFIRTVRAYKCTKKDTLTVAVMVDGNNVQ